MYNFRCPPCVRLQLNDVELNEEHPCFYCGFPIPVAELPDCTTCGLKRCPQCNKCFCDGSIRENEYLIWVHRTYCQSQRGLTEFSGLASGPEPIRSNAEKALFYCSRAFKSREK